MLIVASTATPTRRKSNSHTAKIPLFFIKENLCCSYGFTTNFNFMLYELFLPAY